MAGRSGPADPRGIRLEDEHWVLLDTHVGAVTVRAEPFDAIELELGLLWEDDEAIVVGEEGR